MSPKFEVYQDRKGRWQWRLRAGNHQIVATGHNQGFRSAFEAKRACEAVQRNVLATVLGEATVK